MSKAHYMIIANVLHQQYIHTLSPISADTVIETAARLASTFAACSDRFDKDTFLRAAIGKIRK